MENTKKNNILIGGKKVGKGSHTCVVIPPFKCKTKKLKGKISKIIEKNKVKKYVNSVNNKLKEIDEKQKYTIYFDEMCNIKGKDLIQRPYKDFRESDNIKLELKNSFEDIEELNEGKCVVESDKTYLNFIETYGGPTLYNLILTNKKVNNVSKIILQLLNAVKLLHNNGIVHRDLKLDNVVINPKNGNARLIDFNISRITDELQNKPVDELITLVGNFKYNISLDYIILFYIHILITFKNYTFGKKLITVIIKLCRKKYKNYISSLSDISISYNSLFSTIISSKDELEEDFIYDEKNNLFDRNISKIVKMMYKLYKKPNFRDYYLNTYLYKNDIYGLGIIIKILATKYNLRNKRFLELSNNMISFNPNKRPGINKCIEFLNKK